MSKIVFINPPISMEERLGKFASIGSNMPFLGLLYLAAMTRKNNYATKVIDCPAEKLTADETIEILKAERPDFIGMTASTVAIYRAAELAEKIKDVLPEATIILGGPHVSVLPKKTLELFDKIDIGVVGEGEITIIELLKAIEKKKDLGKVKGIVYRKGKRIIETPRRGLVEKLDSLPMPAFDIVNARNYSSVAYNINDVPTSSIITSRGCPFQCTFCDRTVFGNRVRRHSNSYIMRMIEYLTNNLGIKELCFYDDMFTVYRKEVIELCKLIRRMKRDLRWSCNVRVDCVDEETLELFKEAGCYQVNFGIESGSQKILDSIHKKIDLGDAKRKVAMARRAGLRVRGYFIMGFPDETKETVAETIEYAKTLELTDFQLTFLTPFPGSAIYETAKTKGSFDDDWKKMSYMHCVYTPPGMTKKELEGYIKKARSQFYLRPRIAVNYLKEVRSARDLKKLAKTAAAFFASMS